MDEKTREGLVSAIEKAIMITGEPNYEAGFKKAIRSLESLREKAELIQTVDGLRNALDACEQMSKSDERLALFAAKNLPSLIRVGLKLAAKKAATTLPLPASGRLPAFNATEREEVLDFIAGLIRKGASLDAAKKRAGQKYARSRRTIDRLWSHRADPAEDKPTLAQVIDRINKED